MASSTIPPSIVYSVEDIYRAADSGKQLSDFEVTDEKVYEALLLAVERDNLQAMRALLKAGADVNVSRSSDGSYTALSLAVDKGHTTAVRELLQHGAFLSCEKGIEALDMARENGFLDAVVKGEELLIKQNKEIIMDGKTAVFQAFKNDRLDLVKNLIIAGSYISLMHESTYTYRNNNKALLQQLLNEEIDINIVFKEKTALVMAIVSNSPTCVEILLKSKANLNFVNIKKWTPLHFAIASQHKIVQMLIDAGAEVNAETCDGETPLHLAASRGDIKTIQYLVAAGGSVNCINYDGDSVLMKATQRSSNVKEICTYLVKSGADVNLPNKFGVQPIVNILDIDCLELMQLFIEHGADVNACDSMGRSILSLAIWRRKREITNLLLLKGADVNYMFKGEVPLLVMAVKLGDVKLVKTMLEMGADVTKADINGNTALHVAVDELKFRQSWKSCLENREQFICVYSKEGLKLHLTPHGYLKSNQIVPQEFPSLGMETCCDLVKILIEAGADVKISSESGIQPIVNILDFDSSELVELFLEHGADVNSCDSKGRSILSLAVWNRKEEIAYLLVFKGADVNFMFKEQLPVLAMAVRLGYVELVKKMLEMGADVTKNDNNGNTPLHYTVRDVEFNKTLQPFPISIDRGHSTCSCSKEYDYIVIKRHVHLASIEDYIPEDDVPVATLLEMVKMLILEGSNINQVNNKLESPLHIAIAQNIFVKDKHIKDIKNKSNPNQLPSAETDKEDILNQPLLGCAEHGVENRFAYTPSDKCLTVTIERNAYLQSLEYNPHKDTERHLKIFKILLKTGCNVNQVNNDLESLLCLAIKHKELVDLLIESKADVNTTGRNKKTALHLAASGPEEIVKMLIDAGADVNAELQETDATVESDSDIKVIGRENLDYLSHCCSLFDSFLVDRDFDRYGETPLHIAARSGEIDSLKHLVTAGASVDSLDKNGNSVLSTAIESKSIEKIKYLIEVGANVNVPNKNDVLPVFEILQFNNVKLLKQFVNHGADVRKTDRDGNTSLHFAVSSNDIKNLPEIVAILIKTGVSVNQSNNQLAAPLFFALRHAELVKLLIESKADVNLTGPNKKTALHLAASGPGEIVKMLIDAGADVNAEIQETDDIDNEYVLDSGVRRYGYYKESQFKDFHNITNTTTFEYGETPLHIAAKSGKIDSLKHLVTAGASVNATDKKGFSALSKAVEISGIEISMFLVEAGADVIKPDKHGSLPIAKILGLNSIELVKQYVKHGALLNDGVGRRDSVLTIALYRKCMEIAMCLVESGADVNALFEGHLPALSMAVILNDVKLIKKMITNGADVNKTDRGGNTSLHVALGFGYDKVICIKNALKHLYDTLYTKITMKNRCELVDILIEAGANVNQANNSLESPLHIAVKVAANLRKNKFDTGDESKYNEILTTLINHCAELNSSILHMCLSNGPDLRNLLYNFQLSLVGIVFKKSHFEILQMLVYNGIVLRSKTHVSVSGKTIALTSLMLAIIYRHVDLAKYLLATGYMTVADLRQLQQFDKCPEELNNILCEIDTQPTASTYKLQSLIHDVVSQPWPLVKLAFITVSTMLGEGPERVKMLSKTNLPPKLKQSLNFESPVSFLPVSEWSNIQLCFDPVVYETLPRPRPLLYYWPTGLKTPVAQISLSKWSIIPQFLETVFSDATPEYSLECWSLDASHVHMKCRLTLLKQYTENQNEQLSIHHERHLAEVVLTAAYDIRQRQQRFNDKQREELDPLVECCVESLNACIYYHSTSFDADYGPEYLVLRSGLQFMIEDFESLEFEYDDEDSDFKENITSFTECLESWKKRFGLSDFFNNITHTAEELRRPEGIPAEHTWWF